MYLNSDVVFFGISFFMLLLFVYPYFVYPVVLWGLAVFFPAELRAKESKSKSKFDGEGFALLFSAYNEEDVLPLKLENIKRLKTVYPKIEILAYSDCSSDKTNELLLECSGYLKTIISDVRTGKAVGMRRLVENTTAEILVFTDANVILKEDAISILDRYFYDESIGTVAGSLRYTNITDSTTSMVGGAYWKLEELIKKLETRSGSTMGGDGSIYATRKKYYPFVPDHLLDDFIGSISPMFNGCRVVKVDDVVAYEDIVVGSATEYGRKVRISCRSLNSHKHLKEKLSNVSLLDKFKYTSHKVLRWYGAYVLLFSVIFFYLGIFHKYGIYGAVLVTLLLVFFACIFAAAWKSKFDIFIEIMRSIIATGVGVYHSSNGRRYQIWTPAKREI